MSSLSKSRLDEDKGSINRAEQTTTGNNNQVIGQVLGGMVLYVSGGQPVIHAPPAADSLKPSELGENPYKGLLAFQETDGDRFFGRDQEIEQLWQQFYDLSEAENSVRLLAIYGPSGSGKSSLARAGLVPELTRRPLPGKERGKIASLRPGSQPIKELAKILARIATNDPSPIAKMQEFQTELLRANAAGEYDGLHRIADVLPDITISPLILLVDQLEEIYTLCKDEAERTIFVQALLYAAGDPSHQVSVIVTMRSDFLRETQEHPALNNFFSTQGFLTPIMDEAGLRRAISKPAELAGHPLDENTIDRLISETKKRQGALPLLQFALKQIWEGIEKGVSPADTLEKLGSVGGALAKTAEREYKRLQPEPQMIAQRIFLGLVAIGEGTRDTRRRVAVEHLVSQKNEPAAVQAVLERFTRPTVRLITCSADEDGVEMAEVTHEALFEHWKRLQEWLNENRSDLLFQRRLEVAAAEWEEMDRPEGKLWRSPDLDRLRQRYEQASDEMTAQEVAFYTASEDAVKRVEQEKKRQRRLLVRVLSAGLALTTGASVFAAYQVQEVERQSIEQLATTSEALLLSQDYLEASLHALAAIGASQSEFVQFLRPLRSQSAYASLLDYSQVSARTNHEINRLTGHKDTVTSVAFSPDSKQLVSGSYDGAVRLWNAKTGDPIRDPLTGHEDSVSSVAFSPDGKLLASGGSDRTVRLWNAKTGELIGNPLTGHEDQVTSVAFSPDSELLASGGGDRTVRLWNAKTGEPIGNPLTGHEDWVTSVAFSPNGERLVSGSGDTLRLWNAKTGEPIGESLSGHESGITSVAFSPDGKQLVSGSGDGTLRLWDVQTGEPVGNPLRGHRGSVISVAFSPDGEQLASGGGDTVRLWNAKTGEPVSNPLRGHEGWVFSVAFSPDGKLLVSGGSDHTVRLWNAKTGEPIVNPLTGHEDLVGSVAFSPNGERLVSMSGDGTLRLWNAKTGEPIGNPLRGHESEISSVAFSPNGERLVSGSGDTLRFWNVKAGEPIGNPLRGHEGRVTSVAFSLDGEQLVSGGGDGTLRLWNAKTGEPIGSPLRGHEDEVHSVAFSPDGDQLVSGSFDDTVRLWNAKTGEPIGNPLRGHEDEVHSVAFSPDGKQLVSGGSDGTLRLWNAETGELIGNPLTGQESFVNSVAFSSDGDQLVSGGGDGTLRLWNAKTGEPIGNPLTGGGVVNSVAFSPDGEQLVSGGGDRTVRLWNISQEKLLQRACSQLRRHSILKEAKTDVAKGAKRTCDRNVWSKENPSP